jgi:hypothetical protein
MALFLISTVVIASVIAAMAVGVLMGRAPIKGSCGGIGALGLKDACEICGGSAQRCEEESRPSDAGKRKRDAATYYPASR